MIKEVGKRYWFWILLKFVNNFFWSKLYLFGFMMICKKVLILLKSVFKIIFDISNKKRFVFIFFKRKKNNNRFNLIISLMFNKKKFVFVCWSIVIFLIKKKRIVWIRMYNDLSFNMEGVKNWLCVIVWKLIVVLLIVSEIRINVKIFLFFNIYVKC